MLVMTEGFEKLEQQAEKRKVGMPLFPPLMRPLSMA
jgi:hypothetical protein